MPSHPYIVSTPGLDCCPCNQAKGCGCGPYGCAVQCRSKEGSAVLCGYSEFIDPSVPPKKYRVKTKRGRLNKGTFVTGDCSAVATTNRTGSDQSNPVGYTPIDLTWDISYDPGTDLITVEFTRIGGYDSGTDSYPWAVEWGISASGDGVTYSGPFAPGLFPFLTGDLGQGAGYHTLTAKFYRSGAYNFIRLNYNGRHAGNGSASGFVLSPVISALGTDAITILDDWDLVSTYDIDTCDVSQEDTSYRLNDVGAFPPSTGSGTLDEFGPDDTDFAGLIETVDTSSTERTTLATEICELISGGTEKATGIRTEVLTIEDSEDDAAARAATAIASWNESGPCSSKVTYFTQRGAGEFEFFYRVAQVRAVMGGLTIGLSYNVTIRFFRRPYGSTMNFAYYADLVLLIHATATEATTEWEDVPAAVGYETRAMNCSVDVV